MSGVINDNKRFLDLVSVCICTYKEQDNIEPCIKSIQANGCNRIFVVDSSPDERTAENARSAGAEVIKAPKGLASQRQRAVDHCRSDYLMFVDADDRLAPGCVAALWHDMQANSYDAVQASLGVYRPYTYWQKATDALWRKCLFAPGTTKMVGRPALYRHAALAMAGLDRSFDGVGNEDAALSIRMEQLGYKQGIGTGFSLRSQPASLRENMQAWRKYGKGDAMLMARYPGKRKAILKHLLVVYPIQRSLCLLRGRAGKYAGYCVAMGFFRTLFMTVAFLADLTGNAKVKP